MPHIEGLHPEITKNSPPLDARSRGLRHLMVRMLKGGNRGHIGSTLSLIEIMRVLYDDVMKHDPKNPDWEQRDVCILSKGHGCIAQYAILADKGYFPMSELDIFCRKDSILGGHPDANKVPGVEASTGALGHGLSIGLGMALAARMKKLQSRVFVVMGDGEINEGSVWEAAMSANKHKVTNLVALVDYNKVQAAGLTREILDLEPLADKWRAFGFETVEVDGHNVEALRKVLAPRPNATKPLAVICHTVKGKGLDFAENDAKWHHQSNIKPEVFAQMDAAFPPAA